jgi:hypothetical protein
MLSANVMGTDKVLSVGGRLMKSKGTKFTHGELNIIANINIVI